ncbi:uncharacterized protein K02A2.6-like [Dermacentor silvarum]|uniref:uncharacterized protein K02A2.6-like n=1 Tax=Dermacentor silvarum TaxID=543639 RepID=UPI0021016E9E|nr:uncharacterized protein K02A2.6-like [Dermacentor silvarum]
MRQSMLKRVHAGHLGLQKCKERARALIFWPGLNGDTAALISSFATCRKYAYRQPQEPLLMREVPKCAWYRVGVDIFSYAGTSYVVAYDAFSNFPEVEKLEDASAATTVIALSAMFARYGVPVEVCTDNGPQFSSHEFASFANRYDFNHVTSSPCYPQSNGLAEKGVQIVKRILKKTLEAGDDFWLGLLAYRSAPLEDGRSPGELLQRRRLRSNLPDFRRVSRTNVTKHHQNKAGSPLGVLYRGSTVRLQDAAGWSQKAKVIAEAAPRSYLVKTRGHRMLRRNRRHLLETKEQCSRNSDDDDCPTSVNSRSPCPTAPSEPPAQASPPAPHLLGTKERCSSDSDSDDCPTSVNSRSPCPPTASSEPPDQASPPAPRRSTRNTWPPQRLRYDEHFNQVP